MVVGVVFVIVVKGQELVVVPLLLVLLWWVFREARWGQEVEWRRAFCFRA